MKEKLLRALEKRTKKAKKGFTLVELLVVIAIIAILATVSVVGYLGFTENARVSNDLQELTQYRTLIQGELLTESKTVTYPSSNGTEYKLTYSASTTGTYSLTIVENVASPSTDVTTTTAGFIIESFLYSCGITTLSTSDETTDFTIAGTADNSKNFSITTITYINQSSTGAIWTIANNNVAAV